MNTVKKTTEVTVTLLVLAVGIALLTHWCNTLQADFFYRMDLLLTSVYQIGGFYRFMIRISFWLMIIVAVFDAVLRHNSGLTILGSCALPIGFSLCMGIWGIVAIYVKVNILWFWVFCVLCLIVSTGIHFSRLSGINGAGPSKIVPFLKMLPSANNAGGSIVDRVTLYSLRMALLADMFMLALTLIIFCVQYRAYFGI